MIPQLLYLGLLLIALSRSINEHGKTKTETGNALYSIISAAILMFILWSGGFFDPILKHL